MVGAVNSDAIVALVPKTGQFVTIRHSLSDGLLFPVDAGPDRRPEGWMERPRLLDKLQSEYALAHGRGQGNQGQSCKGPDASRSPCEVGASHRLVSTTRLRSEPVGIRQVPAPNRAG